MNIREYGSAVVDELKYTLSQVSVKESDKLTDLIFKSKKVFIAGSGRSGFMGKAFAMRLMHMGVNAYVVGEAVTPNTEEGNLLIVCSGSGETGSLVAIANKAKKIGANLALVTIFPNSIIGKISDVVIQIPAPTPKVEGDSGFKSIQPMGSLFEQSLLLFLDITIMSLMEKQGKDSNTMFTHHANLE